MTRVLCRRSLMKIGVGALSTPLISTAVRAQNNPIRLRCSLETAPTHMRSVCIKDYLDKVETESKGAIRPELFTSGQLFPDLAVGKALIQRQIEMATPGFWTLTGLISDADFLQQPIMYARPVNVVHRVVDSEPGALLTSQIEQRIGVHVIGPWLDLGPLHWYTTGKPVAGLADLKGKKIRIPGGAGQAFRVRFFGATPNTTPLPDVPLALSQGTFDGMVSTNEAITSLQLWDAGVKYALADSQTTGEHIPMVSVSFWNQLSPDLQNLMTDIWTRNIAAYRAQMIKSQDDARKTMEAHGVQFIVPSQSEIDDFRQKMLANADQAAKESRVSPKIMAAANAAVEEATRVTR